MYGRVIQTYASLCSLYGSKLDQKLRSFNKNQTIQKNEKNI